jgi:vancomycin resistance protein YoaR
MKKKHPTPSHFVRAIFWFCAGASLGLFFFVSFAFLLYKYMYQDRIYAGIFVDGIDFSGKDKQDIVSYFSKKNEAMADSKIIFSYQNERIETTAKDLSLGFDEDLLAMQAYSIGRSRNLFSSLYLVTKAYISGIYLSPAYKFNEEKLAILLEPLKKKINLDPINAQFVIQNGKVTTFRSHQDGQRLDEERLKNTIATKIPMLARSSHAMTITMSIPIAIIKPEVTTEKVNTLGIKELLGSGTSLFKGSIPNRIYNIELASKRLSGILVKPNETFSFAKALGDVSAFTGYKQAYVIQNGRTVLGDGGGVCQVSTTLFRALLNAGLPIIERNQHAYRVSYYEQDMGPGFDAAVYVPSVDLKFTNDTKHYLLIQATVDHAAQRLTFDLYGTSDGRKVNISDPVILSTSPAPEPLYQDDPTLPKGVVKQIDFAAPGAKVYFTREVRRDGKLLYSDKFTSNYRPWQAVFLKGTKEG